MRPIDVLHAAGLRSLGPVWSRASVFATGASGGVIGINLNCCDLRADGADDPATHGRRDDARRRARRERPLQPVRRPRRPRLDPEQLDGGAAGNVVRVLQKTWSA